MESLIQQRDLAETASKQQIPDGEDVLPRREAVPHHDLEPIDPTTHLPTRTRERLRCPACGHSLVSSREELICNNAACARIYPIVEGIPVLIDESRSLFDIADFTENRPTTWPPRPWITRLVAPLIPELSLHLLSTGNLALFAELLPSRQAIPRVLVIGGRSAGHGIEQMADNRTIELVESDVAFGPRTQLICDAHALPFADGTFDGVIAQAVLQYVQDPDRVLSELHRVLGEDGVVYAEVPFVQQGLEGYDFNRFTMLGMRRLFRRFEEVSAGPLVGPATALTWSLQFFFLSFVSGRAARAITKAVTRFTMGWIKHFDRFIISRPGAVDAANELAFIGKKSEKTLSDRELARAHHKFI